MLQEDIGIKKDVAIFELTLRDGISGDNQNTIFSTDLETKKLFRFWVCRWS